MTAQLRELSGGGVPLFCGKITVPVDSQRDERGGTLPARQWYSEMFVWMAPGYFYVSCVEYTGERTGNRRASPGFAPRFLPPAGAKEGAPPPTTAPKEPGK